MTVNPVLALVLGFRIDGTHLSLLVIDHHIMWLDVPVHDTLAVAEIQRLPIPRQQLKHSLSLSFGELTLRSSNM